MKGEVLARSPAGKEDAATYTFHASCSLSIESRDMLDCAGGAAQPEAQPQHRESQPVQSQPTPPPPVTPFKYGVMCQGEHQTCLASPGVCALYFYQFGGEEKTFVFSSGKSVWVQNFNGTLSCWATLPRLADVGTNHPFAGINEIQQARVVFSEEIVPVDPGTLR